MNKSAMGDLLAQLGSILASIMFVWAIIQQYFPYNIRNFIDKYSQRFLTLFYPYIQITFNEFTGERFKRSEAYSAIETYLGTTSSMQAKRLKADVTKNNTQPLSLSMDDHEEVADNFNGVKVYWSSGKNILKTQSFSFYPTTDEKRYYKLTFHKRYRELMVRDYLNHVLKEGREIKVKNRLRKLYTNNGAQWSHVVFEHPASFQTLAMDPVKKQEIIDDLTTFSNAEEFYNRIGRAWKRGYLLFGPPGTGKSTMIAAMANFLSYDIYDLELTAVKDNTELRRLLIETSSKSIIVIEDIDCSMDLTGQRKKGKEEDEETTDPAKKAAKPPPSPENDSKASKVTLSGLLNFVDGLWSACGGDRIIVFTTNHIEKLDPALIRRGRMDKHIELSYCGFEAFRVLARNYLYLEDHVLFDEIRRLLEETQMTPADVAENLMPKTSPADVEACLRSLIGELEKVKREEKQKKIEEEEEERKKKDAPATVPAPETVKIDEIKEVKVIENGSNGSVV
ncbi:AAA-ATPase ASD, mitochondrial-like [Cynara cardunculus var. scolymus]|uniref:AAA+ ATPase domain-containing protein n=1 Tax=Cynara cardunculus var. scolymus TaxID=59895 RepID=A0A118JUW2_CYNCS|nr:AAA-ATPase ASD, mitochondrial-like [Cynara cardunculus var. scolymus]KVH92741.1 AAA+ ATPase domain-containing protein [Cynara cardunculus var. scolymus]